MGEKTVEVACPYCETTLDVTVPEGKQVASVDRYTDGILTVSDTVCPNGHKMRIEYTNA